MQLLCSSSDCIERSLDLCNAALHKRGEQGSAAGSATQPWSAMAAVASQRDAAGGGGVGGGGGDAVKLFVGQVPKQLSEQQIAGIFGEAGNVREINIIKDKLTKQSRGPVAFLTL